MSVGKIGTEFHFMIMLFFVRSVNGLTGNSTKSVIMALVTFSENTGTSGYLMHMFLFITFIMLIVHDCYTPFSYQIYYRPNEIPL